MHCFSNRQIGIQGSKDHLGRLFTHLGQHFEMWTSTFRVNSIGYRPLGLIFLGDRGPWTRDQERGTVGTSRGKRHDIEHIGLHSIHTFRVIFFWGGQGTGDEGSGTVGTSRSKTRHRIHSTPLDTDL